jgi:hypothetical protein
MHHGARAHRQATGYRADHTFGHREMHHRTPASTLDRHCPACLRILSLARQPIPKTEQTGYGPVEAPATSRSGSSVLDARCNAAGAGVDANGWGLLGASCLRAPLQPWTSSAARLGRFVRTRAERRSTPCSGRHLTYKDGSKDSPWRSQPWVLPAPHGRRCDVQVPRGRGAPRRQSIFAGD